MIANDMIVVRSSSVVHTEMNEQTMLMNIEEGKYYSLSQVGSQIWRLLENPTRVDALIAQLEEEFEVTEQECRDQTHEFLQDLIKRQLAQTV